jgi:predicted DNA-binding protein (UPF0278 family)
MIKSIKHLLLCLLASGTVSEMNAMTKAVARQSKIAQGIKAVGATLAKHKYKTGAALLAGAVLWKWHTNTIARNTAIKLRAQQKQDAADCERILELVEQEKKRFYVVNEKAKIKNDFMRVLTTQVIGGENTTLFERFTSFFDIFAVDKQQKLPIERILLVINQNTLNGANKEVAERFIRVFAFYNSYLEKAMSDLGPLKTYLDEQIAILQREGISVREKLAVERNVDREVIKVMRLVNNDKELLAQAEKYLTDKQPDYFKYNVNVISLDALLEDMAKNLLFGTFAKQFEARLAQAIGQAKTTERAKKLKSLKKEFEELMVDYEKYDNVYNHAAINGCMKKLCSLLTEGYWSNI